MNEPLISVVIPVYNVEKYLRQCLDSVLAQTYTNFEVIMVDDGSTDSSYDICLEYSKKDIRFKAFHKENGGASSARNLALKHARGEYYSFIDSDDWIDSNTLERLLCAAGQSQADFVIYEASVVDETGTERRGGYSYHKDYGTDAPYRMMREMIRHREFHVSIPLLFIRRDFFEKNNISFHEGIMYEDMILAYKIYALADKAAHLPEALYHRRYRENSVVTAKKSARNFYSAVTVYNEIVALSEGLSAEKQNYEHVVRCTLNALNDYRALNPEDKRRFKESYHKMKKDIIAHDAFKDKALKYRCKGYALWAAYKVFQKLFIGDRADYRIYINEDSENKKKVAMLMPVMVGGGAERVAAQLINEMHANGIDTKFFLSSAKRSEVVRSDLDFSTPLWLLREEMPKEAIVSKAWHKMTAIMSSLLCKPFEAIHRPVPAAFAKLSVTSQYYREIGFMRDMLKAEPDLTVIAFLQPTIPIALLAARGLPNRVIISERGNPERLMKKRYGRKFIEKYYRRADAAVFQTEDAKNAYPKRIADKGAVIPNPLKTDLPKPYHGERNKNITTFCRISPDKDLMILLQAFLLFHNDYPDYHLRIIGNASNADEEKLLASLHCYVDENGLTEAVSFEPFMKNVHQKIIRDALYVNSSYTEGLCNAMLEAMAIGMPSVCTDCPIGGARATINNGENGILVPVRDPEPLYLAMKRVIQGAAFSDMLSWNAAKIRDRLSLENITKKWMELL